jgi:hypothetical protein
MPTPPAAKGSAAASTDEASRVGASLLTKRLREDDRGMASDAYSQVGGRKKKRNRGHGIARHLSSELEQKSTSNNTVRNTLAIVEGDTEGDNKEVGSAERASEDSEYSRPEERDIIELDRKDIRVHLSSGLSTLVLERSYDWSPCQASFCIPHLLRDRPNIESKYRFDLVKHGRRTRREVHCHSRECKSSCGSVPELIRFRIP